MPYYDADGQEVEGVLPPEEAEKIQEQLKEYEDKVQSFEEAEKRITELETTLKEKENALSKLNDKDLNFKNLRDKTQEEIDEMTQKASAKEALLINEIYALATERKEEREKTLSEAKDEVLNSLAHEDEDLRKKIEAAEKELAGEAKTPAEVEARYRKASILVTGKVVEANPIYSGFGSVNYKDPSDKPKRFSDTPEGQEKIRSWFPDVADKILDTDK